MPRPADAIGQTLNDTYRLESVLGEGGMGTVYRASHARLDRQFAIKILTKEFAENKDALKRFQREARVTSSLGHPNIIDVVDFNETPTGEVYIVMEMLDGEDLAARIERVGRISMDSALRIFRQISSALSAAHAKGVVHPGRQTGKYLPLFAQRFGRLREDAGLWYF